MHWYFQERIDDDHSWDKRVRLSCRRAYYVQASNANAGSMLVHVPHSPLVFYNLARPPPSKRCDLPSEHLEQVIVHETILRECYQSIHYDTLVNWRLTLIVFSMLHISDVRRWDSNFPRSWDQLASDGRNTSIEVFATFSEESNSVSTRSSYA